MQNALTDPPLRTPNFPVDHSDIFSTSRTPSPDSTKGQRTRFPTQEPSDIPRLRTQQNTAGYRDGIAASKSLYIQNGFDEGYSLGAVVGRKAGWILGILGGIATALRNEKDGDSVKTLEQEARKELTVEEVLGKKWWNWEAMGDEDIWKFDIGSTNPSETGVAPEDVSWQQIVDAHPLIKKWTVCITRLAEEWSVDLHRFAREDAPQPDPEEEHIAQGGKS